MIPLIVLLGLIISGMIVYIRLQHSPVQPVELDDTVELVIDEQPLSLNDANENNISSWQVLSSLSALVLSQENFGRIGMATTLTALTTMMNFVTPWIYAETIKLLQSEDHTTEFAGIEMSRKAIITLLVASYFLPRIIINARDQIIVPVTVRNIKKILMLSTEHLLKKSLDYHVNTPISDQIYLFQKSFSIPLVGTPLLTQIAPTVVEILIACTALSTRYGIGMGLSLFTFMSVYTGYSALTVKPIIDAREVMLKAGNEAYESFSGAITRYKIMHDFGKYDFTMKGVDDALNKMMIAEIKATLKPQQISVGHVSIAHLGMLLAGLYMSEVVSPEGVYTTQDFIILMGYINSLVGLLPAFGQAVNDLFASWPDLKFVFNELAKPDEVIDLHPEVPLLLTNGQSPSIEFDNVSFGYAPKPGKASRPLFQNLTFKIEAGEKVALVSESGVGKTTIFNMLFGYYAPTTGTIKINGQNIADVSLQSLQQQISLLGQNPNLFNGSIRDNICFGADNPDDVSDETIWAHAQTLNLHGFLQSFENKLDTDVGENGKALSGGQQQKVAVLRGLIKEAPIRLLDEITAPFDSQSAKEVLQSIDNTSSGVTTLMITHKLAEAQFADKIIVLAEGRAIAQGTHEELLQDCELYQRLWRAYHAHNEAPAASSSTSRMMELLGGSVHSKLSIQEIPEATISVSSSFSEPDNMLDDTEVSGNRLLF